jgi:hypothetical protein
LKWLASRFIWRSQIAPLILDTSYLILGYS